MRLEEIDNAETGEMVGAEYSGLNNLNGVAEYIMLVLGLSVEVVRLSIVRCRLLRCDILHLGTMYPKTLDMFSYLVGAHSDQPSVPRTGNF